MSDHPNADHDEQDSVDADRSGSEALAVDESIEAYETDDGVVFYDAQNPLAWLKAASTLTLKEQV